MELLFHVRISVPEASTAYDFIMKFKQCATPCLCFRNSVNPNVY